VKRVYLFSPIPYSFLHQRPQKLADQFVAQSIPVTFIEPCGLSEYFAGKKSGLVRLFFLSAWYQIVGLLALLLPRLSHAPRPRGTRRMTEGMEIVAMPIVMPANRVNSPGLERLNASIYRQVLRSRIFRHMDPGEESIAIVQNPFWGLVLRKGDFTRITYDCIDEISLFAGHSAVDRYQKYEAALLKMADATFVTAEKLELSLRERMPDGPLVRVPNGVDFQFFQTRAHEDGQPQELLALRHPVIGYVGVLRDWFDYALVGAIARAMPKASFVMVGPLDFGFRIDSLRGIPNLIWPGRKEYRDMPQYINAFDVCLIPFLATKVAETTNPVKIFEYFALGKPVVASPMHELLPFERDGLLTIATGEQAFVEGIRAGLAEKGTELRQRREAIAREHSWHVLAARMLDTAFPGQVR
jgi:glycosyltransferase involved in cell wall biosynthesis